MPATNPAANTGHHAARTARFDPSQQHRRTMIAKVQIARQQLQMDEDDYRQIVFDETGATSLKDCSEAQLARVLDRMKKLGFQSRPKKGAASHPMARKARALWISLHALGAVHNPAEPALEAFAKRQLGCDRLVWAKQSDAYRLIEALKAMAERHGWSQSGAPTPLQLQMRLCGAVLAKMKAAEAVPADWTIDNAALRLCGVESLKDGPWGIEDYARLAGQLGAKARELGVYNRETMQ